MLNSADRVFRELRDLSFAAVGPRLGERAKAIQADYKDSKARFACPVSHIHPDMPAKCAMQSAPQCFKPTPKFSVAGTLALPAL